MRPLLHVSTAAEQALATSIPMALVWLAYLSAHWYATGIARESEEAPAGDRKWRRALIPATGGPSTRLDQRSMKLTRADAREILEVEVRAGRRARGLHTAAAGRTIGRAAQGGS